MYLGQGQVSRSWSQGQGLTSITVHKFMDSLCLCASTATSIESQSSVTDQIGCLRLGKLDVPGAQGTSTPLSGQSSVSAELCTQSQGEIKLSINWL